MRLLGHARRLLAGDPELAVVAVITLALGIGANVTIFSIVNAVLWRPLPYPDSARLVEIAEEGGPRRQSRARVTRGAFLEWREHARTLERIAGYSNRTWTLDTVDGPVRLRGAQASPSLFPLLGVEPAAGRAFEPDHAAPGAPGVALLGDGVWQRVFGRDAAIVGSFVRLNGEPVEVVGVMPPTFRFPDPETDLWTPLVLTPDRPSRFAAIGRLEAGAALDQAEAELTAIARGLAPASGDPPDPPPARVRLTTLKDVMVRDVRASLRLLWLALGCVLGAACINVANLLLGRSAARRRDAAVRSALGAGRLRLVGHALSEGVVLSLAGGLTGLVLGAGLLRFTLATVPQAIPRADSVGVDLTVLGFALLLSLVVGTVTSALPALHGSRAAVSRLLAGHGEPAPERPGGAGVRRVQRLLAVAQVAIASMLLVTVTLLAGSILKFVDDDLGYDPVDVLTARLVFDYPLDLDAGIPSVAAAFRPLLRDVVDRASRLPGVDHAGLVSFLPLTPGPVSLPFEVRGRPVTGEPEPDPAARLQLVTPGYFRTMGMRVVDGARPAAPDGLSARSVLVNETFASAFLDGEPVGRGLRFPAGDDWFRIAGVVGDVVHRGSTGAVEPEVYFSYLQAEPAPFFSWYPYVVLKTARDPSEVLARFRESMREMDPGLPIDDVSTMDDRLAASMALPRLFVFLLGVFAVITLAIASAGLYGVLAHDVARRRREIGIRMALGAAPAVVVRSVMTQSLRLVLAGTAVGLLGAAGAHRLIAHLVVGAAPPVTFTYLTAPLLTGAVSLFACYSAARRATRIEPLEAIRG